MTAVLRSLALSVAALALAAGCEGPSGGCGPAEGTVVEVVDGDTVVLASGEKIRYLLVDTPEITKGNDECYGQEAAAFNKSMVLDQKVSLTYDVECTDRYGRVLAYVSFNGREVNSLLVERGFGCVMHIAPNGEGRVEELEELETAARDAGKGVWACEELPCGD